jgi:hypothetical protein
MEMIHIEFMKTDPEFFGSVSGTAVLTDLTGEKEGLFITETVPMILTV